MSWVEHIKQEITVLKGAPASCVIFASIGFAIAWGLFGERIELLKQQNETYRRDQGVTEAYTGVYAELSNDDLKSKTTHMVVRLRDLQFEYQHKDEDARAQFFANKITSDSRKELNEAFNKQATEEFVKDYRGEAIALNMELRHRLSSQAVDGIVKSGPVLSSQTLLNFSPSEMIGTFGIEMAANELEQLNAKLPADRHRWWMWPIVIIGISCVTLLFFWATYSGVRIVRIRGSQSLPPSQV